MITARDGPPLVVVLALAAVPTVRPLGSVTVLPLEVAAMEQRLDNASKEETRYVDINEPGLLLTVSVVGKWESGV